MIRVTLTTLSIQRRLVTRIRFLITVIGLVREEEKRKWKKDIATEFYFQVHRLYEQVDVLINRLATSGCTACASLPERRGGTREKRRATELYGIGIPIERNKITRSRVENIIINKLPADSYTQEAWPPFDFRSLTFSSVLKLPYSQSYRKNIDRYTSNIPGRNETKRRKVHGVQ